MTDTDEHQLARTRRYVDAPFVQDMLAIARPTLERLIEDEGLPCVRITPRIRRFDLDAVYAWIDSRWSERGAGEAA